MSPRKKKKKKASDLAKGFIEGKKKKKKNCLTKESAIVGKLTEVTEMYTIQCL